MVITILVLFAAVIMPNLKNQKHSQDVRQFFSATRNLMVDARERAVNDGQARLIKYDDSARKLTVETTDNQSGNTQTERELTLPEGVTADAFRLDKADSTSSEWVLGFYADGRSEGGAVQFSADGASQVVIVKDIGSVSVQKGTMPDISQDEWDAGGFEQRA